ncbi:MAG TPA: Wzz/FepE/Etk N-terminal domain-containing protein [Anaerolineaceae bacterium]|nr:Wzz/FepE/Etk N-terminal domain-containing protein [Anaerolineaceae bacterium]
MASNTSQQPGWVPYVWLERSFRNWWLIVLMMILGGLAGLAADWLQPPIYEAKARFLFHINMIETGSIPQQDEEIILSTANSLLTSSAVRDQVITAAKAENISITPEQFKQNASIDRYNEVYELRYRNSDPQVAAKVANLWAKTAYAKLVEASGHARQVYVLRTHIDSLEKCLERSMGPATGQPACSLQTVEQIQGDLSASVAALNTEWIASGGVSHALLFDLSDLAVVPSRPAAFARNTFVLAGSLIGFFLGILAVQSNVPEYLWRKARLA